MQTGREVRRGNSYLRARTAGVLLALCMGCSTSDDDGSGDHGSGSGGSGHPVPVTGGGGAPPGMGSGGHAAPMAGGSGGAAHAMTGGSGGAPVPDLGSGDSGASTSDAGDGSMPMQAGDAAIVDSGTMLPVTYPPLDAAQIGTPAMIADTFSLAEGPVWDHCHGVLLFTDVDAAVIHRLTPPSTVDVFRMDTNYANGIAFDPDGRLLMAEMGPDSMSGRITHITASGTVEVLADKGPNGVALHTSDDLVSLSDGTIYFTDPVYAHGPCVLTCVGIGPLPIYRITPAGMITLEGMTSSPNGIDISPDEKTLYVNSFLGTTLKFDIGADRALTAAAPLASGLTNADSMCVDAGGNVYVGVSAGVDVFRPDGTPVTTIPVSSARGVTNCGFGGDDGKTLYITAWTTLWKVENMPIPGLDWVMNKDMPCN